MPLSSLTAVTPSPYTRTPPARSPKGGERVEIAVDQDDGFRLSLAKLNCIYKGWSTHAEKSCLLFALVPGSNKVFHRKQEAHRSYLMGLARHSVSKRPGLPIAGK